jgi:predicted nucleic acid-binding protein
VREQLARSRYGEGKEDVRHFGSMINAADAPILAAAVRSSAGCLVSGNTRHFTAEVGRKAGIEILTPTAYIAALHI